VEDTEGRAHDLRRLLEGEVAVVSLWYCFCPQFTSQIQRHRDLVTELSTSGARVFTILVGDMVPDPSDGIQDAPESPLLLDPDRAALRAFGHAQTPAYFLVDAEATVRFAYSSPDEISRQTHVLRQLAGRPNLEPE
jgi:peroxiredoxin